MDPGRPPRPAPSDAGGPAAHGGEDSSSSSPPPPPPQQQQQQEGHATPPVPLPQASLPVDHGANAFPSEHEPLERSMGEMHLTDSPPPPQQQQQEGHATPPVPLPQASLPVDHGANAFPSEHEPLERSMGEMHLTDSPPPQQQQQQGHAIQPMWPWYLGAGAPPFGLGLPVPGLTPPPHPQCGSQQQQPYWSSGGYLPTVDAGTAASNFEGYPYYSFGPLLGPTVWEAPPLQPPPIHQDSKLEEIRWLLSHSPVDLLKLVMSPDPEFSEIIAHRLQVGDRKMRDDVFAGFKLCAREIMGNWQGHEVFKALLDCFYRRYGPLQIIVEAAVTPTLVWRSRDGVASLKLLITAVAWHPGLSTRLVNCVLRDCVMDGLGGEEVIAHCFIEMDYEVTKALITHAMETIDDKLHSPFGSACLGTCLRFATDDELLLFRTVVVDKAAAIARGRYGTRLLQHVLDHGNIEFRQQLVVRLMEHVVGLSEDWYGKFVVQYCFLNEKIELLNIVLRACLDLPQPDLHKLVIQGASRNFSILPLNRLLQAANTPYPAEARELAERIDALPYSNRKLPALMKLMSAVRRVLADNLAKLGN